MKHPIYKLFLRDLLYSLSYSKVKYIVFFCFIVFISFAASFQLKSYGSNSVDIVYFLLRDKGYINQLSDYDVPVYFVFIHFFILFLIGDFLFQDFKKNSNYILLRTKYKGHYILSKMGWLFVQNILIYTGVFLIIYLTSSLILGDFSFSPSPFFDKYIEPTMNHPVSPSSLTFRILLGYFMTSLVLSSIQLLCIQFVSPAIAYFGIIILVSISTFSSSKWLPAIHSMILRQSVFDSEHHLTLSFSITYLVVIYVLASLLTYFVFKKKDIL